MKKNGGGKSHATVPLMSVGPVSCLKGLSHEIEMNYKWYKATEPY
jgi:hypothetical protein